MYIIILLSVLLSLIIVFIGYIVFKSNLNNRINQIFFIMTTLVALWALFYVISIYPQFSSISINKLTDVLGLWGSVALLQFTLLYPKFSFHKISKIILYISVILAIIFSPIIIFTPFVLDRIDISLNTAVPVLGKLSIPYFILVLSCLVISAFILIYKYHAIYRHNSPERNKLRFVVVGFGITAVLIAIINILILIFGEKISWLIDLYAPFSPIFFIIFTSYGILKGGLFDVRMAIVRSVTYSLLIATLAGIYAGSTFAISSVFSFGQSTPAQIVSNIVISLILVFLFQPLRRFFDRITNRIFYKDNYNSDEFFGRLNKTLAVTTDLRELLKRASKEIGTTLKSSQAFFYIYTSDSDHHIAAGTSNHTDMTIGVAEDIKQYAINKPGVIVATILEDDNEIKQVLTTHKIEIVLPLIQDKTIIGFLCLGENMGSNYTDRDVSVLNTVSNGLIIAIQNALAVQEIRDFNVTLRQRIAEATQELRVKNAMLKKLDKAKDEFVSMASHQLRTPLTSVKGYLSMVVEGDAGKVTPQQKELLNEAYSSNERMVNLVNDFLNVSRIQTGKFMLEKLPVDLAKLVDEEVKGLVQNASKRQIKLDYKAPVGVPQLNIDEGKIRQVVMNYIDNAIYYSNTDSTIKIDLSVDGDDVVFTVKDTGIGVPVSEQSGLFTKFYRASNAKKQRPDGTGVGLYLAKKIITAHDGKIVFSTVEGRGSTFGFRLPIKELALSPAKQLNDLKD